MIKILSVIVLLTASIFAQNFDEFLDNALKNSPYLKASNLGITQAKERGDALTRYSNPTLDLEVSNFSPDSGNTGSGYRAAYAQPIRLWGVGNDKDALSLAMHQNASSAYKLSKANFTQEISLFFTTYANQKRRLELGYEELSIAEEIYNVSKQRNEAGSISAGELLQAQVAYEIVKVRIQTLALATQESYYLLLKSAGINTPIDLEYTHHFTLIENTNKSNPNLAFIKSAQKKALAQAKVNTNKIEWIDLVAEYESEPNQNIMRVGTSIPLAIFNTKSQEKRISELQADKSQLISENETAKLNIERLRLANQRDALEKLKIQNKKTLKTQTKLLKMFQQGYKIASVNLLQLQSIKNNVIETKENIIDLNTALDKNAIKRNYLSGAYND